MNKYEEAIESIYLRNNGEIDLLTGAMAPDRFDQIVKRDLAIASRASTDLSIISIVLNHKKFIDLNSSFVGNQIKTAIENELVNLYFQLKNSFRQSDCISRVSKVGFWILLTSSDKSASDQLIARISGLLPNFFKISHCQWRQKEPLLEWYKRIDQIHFNNAW